MTGPWKAEIFVESHELSLAEVERLIGRKSKHGFSLGDRLPEPHADRVHKFTAWKLPIPVDDVETFGVDGLSQVIEGIPLELADQLARLPATCESGLLLVQDFEETDAHGVYLSPEAIGILARMRASITIDQYGGDGPQDVLL